LSNELSLDADEQAAADELAARVTQTQQAAQALSQQLIGMLTYILKRKGLNAADFTFDISTGKVLLARPSAEDATEPLGRPSAGEFLAESSPATSDPNPA
jgi:hypothetical protein